MAKALFLLIDYPLAEANGNECNKQCINSLPSALAVITDLLAEAHEYNKEYINSLPSASADGTPIKQLGALAKIRTHIVYKATLTQNIIND